MTSTFMFYGAKEVHTVKISLSLLYFNRIHLLTSFLCLLVILVEWTQLLHPPSPKDNPACLPDFVGGSTVSGGWLASTGYPWQLLPPWSNLDIPCVLTWTTEIHLISFAGVDNGALKVCGNTHCAWHDSWAKFSTQSLTKILSAEYQC